MTIINKIYHTILVIPKLGFWNFFYMLWYRFSLQVGLRKLLFPVEQSVNGEFFHSMPMISEYPYKNVEQTITKANDILDGRFTFFHYHRFKMGDPPNWFQNPFNGKAVNTQGKHWTELNDFSLDIGDIKTVWELSRFDWLTDLARVYRLSGESKYLDQLNILMNDWSKHNPLNKGVNWKCGQEASFRVMKLITTAEVLNQFKSPSQSLCRFVFHHLIRISPNINYAIAQDNNHATSEAAALFIGSAWLLKFGKSNISQKKLLNKWKNKGRKVLEERILKLISKDGTFSQKSINYHRVLIDTLSWVLITMSQLDEQRFSEKIDNRIKAAGNWFYQFVNIQTGDVPNIGANDGAMIENLHNVDYRDFRPSVQQFFVAAHRHFVYPAGEYDEPLFWRLGESLDQIPFNQIEKSNALLLDNEFLILRNKDVEVFLKIPKDDFRPQNNPLHAEIYYKGRSIVIGPGTYSYNAGVLTKKYKSIASCNTIQFNNEEPMPVISRFLTGAWIEPDTIGEIKTENGELIWSGSYRDYKKNWHLRTISLYDKKLEITDTISTDKPAKLFWHINDLNYSETDHVYKFQEFSMRIKDVEQINVTEHSHSLYYFQQTPHRRFEIPLMNKTVVTTFDFFE